jgi:hypothetical protein
MFYVLYTEIHLPKFVTGLAFTLSVGATETTLERHIEVFCEDGYVSNQTFFFSRFFLINLT